MGQCCSSTNQIVTHDWQTTNDKNVPLSTAISSGAHLTPLSLKDQSSLPDILYKLNMTQEVDYIVLTAAHTPGAFGWTLNAVNEIIRFATHRLHPCPVAKLFPFGHFRNATSGHVIVLSHARSIAIDKSIGFL